MPMMYYGMDGWFFPAILAVMLLSFIAQGAVQRAYKRYSKVAARSGIPAHQAAARLLREHNSAVQITPVRGSLTDHFNPKTNIVGLSETVYNESSVAALAVAAHEIGHVIQYQDEYGPIKFRNAILPVASFSSQAAPFIILIGYFMQFFALAYFGVVLFAAVFLFQLVTLPVEFNASSRALAMLENGGYITTEETPMAKKVLRAAAFTYVVAALSSLVYLLRYIGIARNSKR